MKSETPQPAAAQPLTFRKKPVVIEAVHYAGSGNMEPRGGLPDWLWDALDKGTARFTNGGDPLILTTLESDSQTVSPGDWIIRGVKGELYPCKSHIFALTYEAVSEVQPTAAAPVQDLAYDVRMMTDKQLADVLSSRAALDANQEFGRWLGRLMTAWVTDSPLADIDAIIAERATPIPRSCPEHLRLTADELYRVMQAWEGQPAGEEQTRIVIKLGALREGAVRAGDSPFVTPLDQPIPQPLQPPAAAKPEPDDQLRTCSLCQAGYVHADCDTVGVVISQPAAAPPHPFAVGTEARYKHDIETRDMVISSLTEKLAVLQPAAAAPPIDLLELEQLIEEKRGRCRYWNVSVQGYSELQDLIREGEFLERLLARLRALQGTEK